MSDQILYRFLNTFADTECPSIEISRRSIGDLRFELTKRNWIGSVAEFYCTEGYFVNGTTKLQCMENGQWSSRVPHCSGKNGKKIWSEGKKSEFSRSISLKI